MYQSICVPMTGDEPSEGTEHVAFADAFAETFEGKIAGLGLDTSSRAKTRLDRLASILPEQTRQAASSAVDNAAMTADGESTEIRHLEGAPLDALRAEWDGGNFDLLVTQSHHPGENRLNQVGSFCERMIRHIHMDTLIVKKDLPLALHDPGTILVCIDGSQESYAGLKQALVLSQKFGKTVEAVAVYDPYIHYTLFNGIVNVLTEEASRVFKFADQEKLHEEIIDTGLAKIYQAHLEVARAVAQDEGQDLRCTLLDGKAFQKVLSLAHKTKPWLVVMGRIGVHSEITMDVGSTCENLLRALPGHILVTSSRYLPPVDAQAEASIQWTEAAEKKMERVPSFVKGVATTAIIRWAIERGHSVITPSVINSAMGDLLPPSAAQAMGYVAEEVAIQTDRLREGKTFICPQCGYAARDFRPVACSVCKADGALFEAIDRDVLEAAAKLEAGALMDKEETFDGKTLSWLKDAKEVLRRVPSGYERRRAKARIEKTARVRGLELITKEFAVDMVQQEMAENAYLSKRGDHIEIKVNAEEKPDDTVAEPREESPLPWTEAAWKRICRVPEGFMRDMTREKVESFADAKGLKSVDLSLCEEGIAEGRKMMADMLGSYSAGGKAQQEMRAAAKDTKSTSKDKDSSSEKVSASSASKEDTTAPAWTEAAVQATDVATNLVVEAGKFEKEHAVDLAVNVTEERAKQQRLDAIGESFMKKLGSQLGYGHPLSEKTSEYQFEWTPEAEERLKDIPEFCREMSRWRVEWTAVKKNLGFVITPEIMDVKFDMWGDVSEDILNRDESAVQWTPEAMARLEKIPDFVKGQVIQSVEGNAREWGTELITNEILDKVIQKWIETGDFHEGLYGYK